MYKHSVAVARCQPFHIGHERLIDRMLEDSEMVTIILGSIGKRDEKNPWPFHDRKSMIKNVYKDKPDVWKRLRILGAYDIGDNFRWPSYILNDVVKEYYVKELEMEPYPEVDAYYAGCTYDAQWFRGEHLEAIIVDRTTQTVPYVSATLVREMGMLQDPRWMLYVNKENHELVKKYFDSKKWDCFPTM